MKFLYLLPLIALSNPVFGANKKTITTTKNRVIAITTAKDLSTKSVYLTLGNDSFNVLAINKIEYCPCPNYSFEKVQIIYTLKVIVDNGEFNVLCKLSNGACLCWMIFPNKENKVFNSTASFIVFSAVEDIFNKN